MKRLLVPGLVLALAGGAGVSMVACGGGGGGGGGGGSGSTAVQYPVVAAAGGTIEYTSPDNSNILATLSIPPGALAADTTITVDLSDAIADSNVIPGLGFEFLPDGLAFAQSVDLVVTYDETDLPPGTDEAELRIHKWTGTAWDELQPSTVDTTASTVTAVISGFSLYYAFPGIGPPPLVKLWTHPSDLGDHVTGHIGNAGNGELQIRADMADNGEAVVGWLGSPIFSGQDRVFFTEYRGGTWTHGSSPIDSNSYISLDPPPGFGSQIDDLAVDMNESGDTIIAFNQYDWGNTAAYRVYHSLYTGAWNHPAFLSTDAMSAVGPNTTRPDAYYPAAAIDGSGEAILAWHMKDAADEDRYYRREYRSSAWSALPIPATDAINQAGTAGEWKPPMVAANENGDAIIVWEESGGLMALHYRDAGGGHAWSSTVEAVGLDPSHSDARKIVMSDNGDVVIVVKENNSDVVVSRKPAEGSWTAPLELNDSATDVVWEGIDVDIDGSGNIIVVWQQYDYDFNKLIFMREYNAAADTWSPEPDVPLDAISPPAASSTYLQSFLNPKVAMGDNGDAIIVFGGNHTIGGICAVGQSWEGPCGRVYMTQRSGGGSWTHETGTALPISPVLNDLFTSPDIKPAVAMDGEGNAIVVWPQYIVDEGTFLFMSEYR